MSKEVAYSFSTPNGIFTVTTADTTTSVADYGTGYAITGISGTFNGNYHPDIVEVRSVGLRSSQRRRNYSSDGARRGFGL